MRFSLSLLAGFAVFSICLLGSTQVAAEEKQKFAYQSDVARLRKIVINSLYSHRDVFLRELISNANDALEKLRLTSLKDKGVLEGAESLNITIKTFKHEDGSQRLVISDTGIGMTQQELTANLGTLAKSGTTEFLSRAENTDTTGTGNLIGAFGLGFYSSFLVADQVYVSSIAAKSSKNPSPAQYIFSSSADDSSFEVYPDPRGNTLGRGTEITLVLKEDAAEYMSTDKLNQLINKHSSFASSFPIYLFTQKTEEVVDAEAMEEEARLAEAAKAEKEAEKAKAKADDADSEDTDSDEEEAVVEEETDNDEELEPEPEVKLPKMKTVTTEEWVHMNSQPPIWTRDPKTVTDEEYEEFYKATFKDTEKPLAWYHFAADSGAGVSFRSIIYIPSKLEDSFWQSGLEGSAKDVRLMVKRVFITNDFGVDALPKWASWVKVVVDAEDLPLNVSRETLQNTKFLKQLRGIIVKRLLLALGRLKTDEPEKYQEVIKVYNNAFKLGAVEDSKSREKLASFVQFPTNQKNETSLDGYLEAKKQGQKQIFYLADMGKTAAELAKSVFIEKLDARGYEIMLLSEPLDEVFFQNLRQWKKFQFQDAAKAGLKFGDEELDPEEERAQQAILAEEYKPLLEWLKKESPEVIRDVVISNRLVKSSCAVVADVHGYTANVERIMNSNQNQNKGYMHEFAKRQRLLEINPRSPLIEGLLKRVKQLPSEEEERDLDAEDELREVSSVLVDGALVRSGFGVSDSNEFFVRVDRILRRSLGVSETAPTDETVKPAPPVDPEMPKEEDDSGISIEYPGALDGHESQVRWEVEEIDDEGNPVKPQASETPAAHHDEL